MSDRLKEASKRIIERDRNITREALLLYYNKARTKHECIL